MREQVMTLRPDPLLIATAHGLIEIHRVNDGVHKGRGRQLRLMLPEGLVCSHKKDKALETPWLRQEGGRIAPAAAAYETQAQEDGSIKLSPIEPPQVSPSIPMPPPAVIRVVRRAS